MQEDKRLRGACLCVQNMSLSNLERMGNVLADLDLHFVVVPATFQSPHVQRGETCVCVLGTDGIQKLREFTRSWTVSTSKLRGRGRV